MTQKPPDPNKPLLPRQKRFVEEYLIDFNGTQAAIRAGYSPTNAKWWAQKALSRDQRIRDAIEAGKRERAEITGVTERLVVRELARLGLSSMGNYVKIDKDGNPRWDFASLTDDEWAAISELTIEEYMEGRGKNAREVKRVRVKLASKRGPLQDLLRHMAMEWPTKRPKRKMNDLRDPEYLEGEVVSQPDRGQPVEMNEETRRHLQEAHKPFAERARKSLENKQKAAAKLASIDGAPATLKAAKTPSEKVN